MKIKDKLKQFGILVIRLIWPGRGSKSTQRLGILVVGLGLMFGVSQAGELQKALASVIGGQASIEPQQPRSIQSSFNKTSTADVASQTAPTSNGLVGPSNIVDLIGDSDLIVRGLVKDLSDGFENGVPYTQVTLKVTESLRGQFGDEYKFRQFGLLQPKKMENGKVNLNVTPDGWSRYKQGEDVVLFLYKQASITKLRTTTGLGQGKVVMKGGNAESQFGNSGLFENVEVDQKLVNDRDKRLLATKKGAVNTESFMSFVRKAVKSKWVEGGKLRHAKK